MGKFEGYIGCKPGITPAAGPCIGGYVERPKEKLKLAIVLLRSRSKEARWIEIECLVNFIRLKRPVLNAAHKKRVKSMYASISLK